MTDRLLNKSVYRKYCVYGFIWIDQNIHYHYQKNGAPVCEGAYRHQRIVTLCIVTVNTDLYLTTRWQSLAFPLIIVFRDYWELYAESRIYFYSQVENKLQSLEANPKGVEVDKSKIPGTRRVVGKWLCLQNVHESCVGLDQVKPGSAELLGKPQTST